MPIHPGYEIERDMVETHMETILNQAENPLQAARLIREAYAKKGYVLVNVQPSVSGNYAIFLVQEYRITRIEGPEYAKIYMSSLINRKDVLQAEFNRKLANALNEAARKGERLEINPGI